MWVRVGWGCVGQGWVGESGLGVGPGKTSDSEKNLLHKLGTIMIAEGGIVRVVRGRGPLYPPVADRLTRGAVVPL